MKVLRNLCIGAVAIRLTPFAFADKYDDLGTKGYRWVSVGQQHDQVVKCATAIRLRIIFLELVAAEVPLITVDHAAQLDACSLCRRTKPLESAGVPSVARRNA